MDLSMVDNSEHAVSRTTQHGWRDVVRENFKQWFEDRQYYRFSDRWLVSGTIDEVLDVFVHDSASISRWWPHIRTVDVLEREEEQSAFDLVVAVIAQGYLPYTVPLTISVLKLSDASEFHVLLDGGLRGTACVRLTEADAKVRVNFELDVEVRKRLLRILSVFARPLVMSNHNWVFRWRGETYLNGELQRRRQAGRTRACSRQQDERVGQIPAKHASSDSSRSYSGIERDQVSTNESRHT